MKVSIITACYNSAAVIETAMESVLGQSWPEIEYLVVDGGSQDGTVALIEQYAVKFSERMRWVSEADRGMYDAINKGIAMASGEFVGILNADDVLAHDGVIEELVRRVEARREGVVEAVYGDIRFVANGSSTGLAEVRRQRSVRYYAAKRWRPWMLQWGFMPPHPSVYIRRSCFERLGVYALDYEIAADYALLVRFLRKAGLRTLYLDQCMVTMRMGGKSTRNWRSNWVLNREIVRGNREAGYFCCMLMMVPKYLFKVWEFSAFRGGKGRGETSASRSEADRW